MPTLELTAIGTRERAGAKSAHGRALPVAVVDHAVNLRLLAARILKRLSNRTLPSGIGNLVTRQGRGAENQEGGGEAQPIFHRGSIESAQNALLKRFSIL